MLFIGGRYSTPKRENISVGVSFFAIARDAVILYKDTFNGYLYVIDAKGVFAPLVASKIDRDLSNWWKLPWFRSEADLLQVFERRGVSFDANHSRRQLSGVSLGFEWDASTGNVLVKASALLAENELEDADLKNLLREETFNNLALMCKTRGQLGELHRLLARHKQQEVVVRLEDRHGGGELMEELQATTNAAEKLRLTERLREAHAANRVTYEQLKDQPSAEQ